MSGSASGQTLAEADKLNAEAIRLYQAGKYAEAIPIAQRALALRENEMGPKHSSVGPSLSNLAVLYQALGRTEEAEPLLKRALALREAALGPDHPDVARSLNHLSIFYLNEGRIAEAEPPAKRGLTILEKALGPEHPDVAISLDALVSLYMRRGRYGEAEPLLKRALALREASLGPEHPDVARSLDILADLYDVQGRAAEAELVFKRTIHIYKKALGIGHPDVGERFSALGIFYMNNGRHREAEVLLNWGLAIREKALGSGHPDVGASLNGLGALYRALGRYSEAEALMKRSLTISETTLPPEHPNVVTALHNLAMLALAQNDLAGAAEHWQRASVLQESRVEHWRGGVSGGTPKWETRRSSSYSEGLVKAMYRVTATGREAVERRGAEMFKTAQRGQGSEAAASLAQMAARSAVVSPELAGLVRGRQDLLVEWQGKDKQFIAARSEPQAKRNAAGERELADRLTDIEHRIAAIDVRLAKDFPDYAALASPYPMTVAEVQTSLRDNEALVLILDTAEFKPLPEETFIWIVTKTDVRWLRSDLGTAALQREVSTLRCGLDATTWHGDGARRCADLLNLALDKAPKHGESLPFDAKSAFALYSSLFGEGQDLIAGKHLLIVPSGALTTLPFQVLVTKAPKSPDLASLSWLVREHAITVLPSVASLISLRRTGKQSAAPKAMIGFANPLLDGDQAHPQHGTYFKQQARLAQGQTGCAEVGLKRTGALRMVARSVSAVQQGGTLADLDHLRKQSPLPETADELCQVARDVGGNVEDMRVGARATETELKRLSASGELAQYRMLHFATHGTLAGQLKGTTEPGLILSPPKTATAEDDGYLSGSEIAALKLDADWVILSACNTAGGAGQGEAAEALSGLARVFFYAGARALLVSHWEVDSDAAVKLVAGAVGALAKDKNLGRAQALRRAMLAMMADTTRPADWVPAWHPAVWAPFIVVGEGGAGR